MKKEQICHARSVLPPTVHLLFIISVKRMHWPHADVVMWRGWISFAARKVSLGFSCESSELLPLTTDGDARCLQGKCDHFQMFLNIHLDCFQSNNVLFPLLTLVFQDTHWVKWFGSPGCHHLQYYKGKVQNYWVAIVLQPSYCQHSLLLQSGKVYTPQTELGI